jgi:hypothetical protein
LEKKAFDSVPLCSFAAFFFSFFVFFLFLSWSANSDFSPLKIVNCGKKEIAEKKQKNKNIDD